MIILSPRRIAAAAAVGALVAGALAAWHYHRLGLTLSHYDARGHLVVARRIVDSITPGWQQIGAVWLPLPHLINAIPVQIDLFYRTGASAVAISIVSHAIATGAIAWIVLTLTESAAAAGAAAVVFALNPNVLYLQSTPMTEPLLLATTTVAVAMLIAWCRDVAGDSSADALSSVRASTTRRAPRRAAGRLSNSVLSWIRASTTVRARRRAGGGPRENVYVVGAAFALACLTRYEAWPVTVSALVAAAWARWRRGVMPGVLVREIGSIALYPALAIAGFTIFSRIVVGHWFVSGDFFVPENKALGDPMMAAKEIGWGARQLSGAPLTWIGAAGVVVAIVAGLAVRSSADMFIVVSLLATAAVPWTAFLDGHPFRIRYMVPLVAIEAIGAGLVARAVPRRARAACAIAIAALAAYELRPLDASVPMVVEAQWDRPNAPVRAQVTACLAGFTPGDKVMASMGSLGHYMQETSRSGFAIRDFLHEGNGDIWLAALERPRPFAKWMLIEEKAQGGDMLAHIAHERPSFLAGYVRVCEGAGLALYRRIAAPQSRVTQTP